MFRVFLKFYRRYLLYIIIVYLFITGSYLLLILYSCNTMKLPGLILYKNLFYDMNIRMLSYDSYDYSQIHFYVELKDKNKDFDIVFWMHNEIATIVLKSSKDYKVVFDAVRDIYHVIVYVPILSDFNVKVIESNKVIATFTHTIKFDDKIESRLSVMNCSGIGYYDRICYIRNLGYMNEKFYFYSEYDIVFNKTILLPGSRPFPFDYPACRTIFDLNNIVIGREVVSFDEILEERSFVTCRWYSMNRVFHQLFDFTIPLWHAKNLHGGHNESDNIILVDDKDDYRGCEYLSLIGKNPINIRVFHKNKSILLGRAVVGVPKSEFIISPDKWKSLLDLPYEFPPLAFKGLRDYVVNRYDLECRYDRPTIVYIGRNRTKRYIENEDELLHSLQRVCSDECKVKYLYLDNMSKIDQVKHICGSSVLIGMHGGGLSNMIWTNVGSSIVEIFPYKYNCRQWYKSITEGLGINYFSWINNDITKTRDGRGDIEKYNVCLEKHECLSDCHDTFRDQITAVNVTELENILKIILKQKKTRKK